MVGHKFGEFSPTRVFHGHSGIRSAKRAEGEEGAPAPRAAPGAAAPAAPAAAPAKA
jgi:hypothetical protein